MHRFSEKIEENIAWFKDNLGGSADFYTKKMQLCGSECCILYFDSISGGTNLWEVFLEELSRRRAISPGWALQKYIVERSRLPVEPKPVLTLEEAVQKLASGFGLFLIDGCRSAVLITAQNMKFRSVDKPSAEGEIRGSQEAFTDLLRVNLGLLRRLIRSDKLVMEVATSQSDTGTEYAICYYKGRAPEKMLAEIRKRLKELRLPLLLDSSYLTPFLQKRWKGVLQPVGYTERPVTACAKICEGKVVVMVNGSPFVLIYPYFFAEHFECLDDYASAAYFAALNRILKYFAFILSIFLPGIYVMAVAFTPELMPRILLEKILQGAEETPLTPLPEMALVLLVLEIIRIAGLRMPKAAGGTVSLIAALVVGSTAVEAGLMSTPLVLCAAISAISMYALPSLYDQISLLRLLVLFFCGILGPVGLALSIAVLLAAVSIADDEGQAYLYPLSPLQKNSIRDGYIRMPWKRLKNSRFSIAAIRPREAGEGDER